MVDTPTVVTPAVVPAPEEPKKLPDIVQKLTDIIQEQSPFLVATIRKLRTDEGLMFQNMTRQQIRGKFNVIITGQENYPELRQKAASTLVLYQEVSGYLIQLESELDMANVYIDQIKSHLDQEIIMSNLTKGRNDRISDAARESLVSRIYTVGDTGLILGTINAEIGVWKGILKELEKVFETIDKNMMALSCEFKHSSASQT